MRLGAQELHDSHRFGHKRGIVWCWHCGYYGSQRAERLAHPCQGKAPRGSAGWDYLARLRKGLTPKPHMMWPPDEAAAPPTGLLTYPAG